MAVRSSFDGYRVRDGISLRIRFGFPADLRGALDAWGAVRVSPSPNPSGKHGDQHGPP
jgi:hypothetical protein